MNHDSLVITKQKYPFHTSLCKNILNLDENIRSTAIVDTDGTVYTLVHREGHTPAISDDESTTVLIQAVSRFSNRKLQEKRFGKTIFSMTLHEKLARVTIPIDNTHVLMFSVDRKAKSYDDVIKKTLQYLSKQRGWVIINTEFELPHGFVDKKGKLHKFGIMRPVSDSDEVFVTKHARYNVNHSFRMIALLSKVIIQLGTLDKISTDVIEKLYEEDLKFLIDLYNQVNEVSVAP